MRPLVALLFAVVALGGVGSGSSPAVRDGRNGAGPNRNFVAPAGGPRDVVARGRAAADLARVRSATASRRSSPTARPSTRSIATAATTSRSRSTRRPGTPRWDDEVRRAVSRDLQRAARAGAARGAAHRRRSADHRQRRRPDEQLRSRDRRESVDARPARGIARGAPRLRLLEQPARLQEHDHHHRRRQGPRRRRARRRDRARPRGRRRTSRTAIRRRS